MNEPAICMDANSQGQGRSLLEPPSRENFHVPVRADRAFTLTDELNERELQALRRRRKAQLVAEVADSPFRTASYNLRPELKPVNRILERWAVGEGSGLPDDDYNPPLKSKPTPLDDETQVIVCEVINRRISSVSRKLIVKWYRSTDEMPTLREKLGFMRFQGRKRMRDWRGRILKEMAYLQMTENGVILAWNLTLGEVRMRFEETRHPELLRLIAVRY